MGATKVSTVVRMCADMALGSVNVGGCEINIGGKHEIKEKTNDARNSQVRIKTST